MYLLNFNFIALKCLLLYLLDVYEKINKNFNFQMFHRIKKKIEQKISETGDNFFFFFLCIH